MNAFSSMVSLPNAVILTVGPSLYALSHQDQEWQWLKLIMNTPRDFNYLKTFYTSVTYSAFN